MRCSRRGRRGRRASQGARHRLSRAEDDDIFAAQKKANAKAVAEGAEAINLDSDGEDEANKENKGAVGKSKSKDQPPKKRKPEKADVICLRLFF